MENSSNPVASTDEQQEESGWTTYFEDFLATQRREDQNSSSTTTFSDQESFCSPSLVSDAASCAPSKNENRNQFSSCSPITEDTPTIAMHKTASFKKVSRTEEISHDDSLEDTASSPASSPKVCSLEEVDIINPRERDDNNGVEISNSLGKGGGSDCFTEIPTEGGNHEMTIEGYTELNKRGMCLVPLSILLNYLG